MRRIIALLLLIVGLSFGTWLREPPPKVDNRLDFQIVRLPTPTLATYRRHLGPLTIEAIWELTSPRLDFGGFSSLLPPREGRMVTYSDRGWRLEFPTPGRGTGEASFQEVYTQEELRWYFHDIESATRDPVSGTVWLGIESRNAIARIDPRGEYDQLTQPKAMRDWGGNSGPEAMARLADGRFIVLREGLDGFFASGTHKALLFAGDPLADERPIAFRFAGSAGFKPTDMAQLPDGRILILERKLLWPFPPRFAARIVIADPSEIRPGGEWQAHPVALLSSPLPVDNFEGMTVAPRGDGKIAVWVISDDNRLKAQRTLLWELSVDPADLPSATKDEADGKPAASSEGTD